MPDIQAFRGYRYDLGHAMRLSLLDAIAGDRDVDVLVLDPGADGVGQVLVETIATSPETPSFRGNCRN